jgi:glyoxylase-like metal-dependent hydrolase (beta-lactamase superfamily II)
VTAPIEYDRVVRLSPRVRRLTQRNPGLFTGPGTNTHLVGGGSGGGEGGSTPVIVLDPGEDLGDGHLERIVEAIGGAPVVAIIPSHGHPDHWPLAPKLAVALRAPVWAWGGHPEFRADRSLGDGERISAGATHLEVLRTPGHARDHLAFVLEEEAALFPGDLVMGWSTSIIAPPDGDLNAYLASLERLLTIPGLTIAYPAHGEALSSPYDRIRELRAHREMRTRQALEALGRGPGSIGELVKQIYADVDPALHAAAAQSLLAHLLALAADGLVERSGGGDTESAWNAVVWRRRRG